jgi:hypothetical protein
MKSKCLFICTQLELGGAHTKNYSVRIGAELRSEAITNPYMLRRHQ